MPASKSKHLTNDVRISACLNLVIVGLADLDKAEGIDPTKNPATIVCVEELNRRAQKYANTDLRDVFVKRVQRAKKRVSTSAVSSDSDAVLLVVAVMRLISSITNARPGTALGFISSQFGKNVELIESKLTPEQIAVSRQLMNRIRSVISKA